MAAIADFNKSPEHISGNMTTGWFSPAVADIFIGNSTR